MHGAEVLQGLMHHRAPGTLKTYSNNWNRWVNFCHLRSNARPLGQAQAPGPLSPWAATPYDVADFLMHLAPSVRMSSVQPYLSCINSAYRDLGLPAIGNDQVVKATRAFLERVQVPLNSGESIVPMDASAMKELLDDVHRDYSTMEQPLGPGGLRYLRSSLAAIIGFVSGSRPGALVRLPVENLRVVGPQLALLERTETKTSPNSPLFADAPGRRPLPLYFRDSKVCTLLTMYIENRARLPRQPRYFFSLTTDEDKQDGVFTLWFDTVLASIRRTPPAGCKWTPKSLRKGFATASHLAGADLLSITNVGGWAPGSSTVARDYIRADYTRDPSMVYFFGHLNKDSQGFNVAANAFRAVYDDAGDADA